MNSQRQAYFDLFDSLEVGDLVRICGRNRIVRGRSGRTVTFSILRKSWTGHPTTTYTKHDLYGKLVVVQKGYGAERTELERRLQAQLHKRRCDITQDDVIGVIF